MRYLKMAVSSFIVFFSLFTLIGLLFPSNIKSVHSVVVNKNRPFVLKELRAASGWIKWYPFFQPLTGGHIDHAENDSTLFFNDKKEILLYNKRADSNSLSFFTQYRGNVTEHIILVLDVPGNSSQVQVMWHEKENLKWYPWDRFRGLVLEKAKVEYLDSVLTRFRNYVETVSTD